MAKNMGDIGSAAFRKTVSSALEQAMARQAAMPPSSFVDDHADREAA
jgi:hypothetical protein